MPERPDISTRPDTATFPSTPVRHVLTEAEFDVLWDEMRLGPTPVVLRLPSPGRTRAERARIVADGRDGLRRRGLADLSGPAPGPARLLGLLAAPRRQLELRAWFGRPVRALAAERDGDGALAVRRDGHVELRAAGTPAHAVRATLPHRAAGRGRAVSLPTAALAGVLADTDGRAGPAGLITGRSTSDRSAADARSVRAGALTDSSTPDTITPEDAALLARLLGGPGGRAQVAAVVHDRWGSPHRPVAHVTVLDTPLGRYRLTHAAAADGTDWSTLAPVDERGLHALLAGLLDDAAAECGPDVSPGRSAASAGGPLR